MGATAPLLDVSGDFPILSREVGGKRLIYLDSAATAQKPAVVIDAMSELYRTAYAPIHRSVYKLAEEATEAFEGARARIAAFVGADADTTIFTANASEAINLVAYSWARTSLKPGDAVLLTRLEHHSNIVPWQQACEATGATLRWLDIDDDGQVPLDALRDELARGDVRLVAFAHVSNVTGTILPVAEIAALVREAGAVSVIDGTQGVPQLPVDISAIGADFYAWTGHKAFGPTGIGVLHGRRELLEAMPPFISGGHMIRQVGDERSTWNDLPWKFEAGTSAIAEAVGLGAAVDWLAAIGMDAVRAHELELMRMALARLGEMSGVTIVGPPAAEDRGGVLSFVVDGMHPHDVAELLGRENVCVRAGHHCAQPLMRRLGVAATSRASLAPHTLTEDIDALARAIAGAQKVFGV